MREQNAEAMQQEHGCMQVSVATKDLDAHARVSIERIAVIPIFGSIGVGRKYRCTAEHAICVVSITLASADGTPRAVGTASGFTGSGA